MTQDRQLLALEERLGYSFRQRPLLQMALTHRSHSFPHSERLEFLGDGVLDFLVADLLYQRYPEAPEGDLTRQRASLVRQETLVELATQLELGRFIRLGEGELRSGGHRRPSILADSLEAILGAVYLDGGIEPVRELVRKWLDLRMSQQVSAQALKDPKTRLQEFLQGKKRPLPGYRLLETSGLAHSQTFQVVCEVEGVERGRGLGSSRRQAEQQAAEQALAALEG